MFRVERQPSVVFDHVTAMSLPATFIDLKELTERAKTAKTHTTNTQNIPFWAQFRLCSFGDVLQFTYLHSWYHLSAPTGLQCRQNSLIPQKAKPREIWHTLTCFYIISWAYQCKQNFLAKTHRQHFCIDCAVANPMDRSLQTPQGAKRNTVAPPQLWQASSIFRGAMPQFRYQCHK